MTLDRRTLIAAAIALPIAARAAVPSAPVTVDRVDLTIVADGTAALFGVPASGPGFILVPTKAAADYHDAFEAQWSYSVLAETRQAATARRILIDFGFTPAVFANNLKLLGIDPASFDAMVLSHGHYDHFGGLQALIDGGRVRAGTPLYVGGEEAFCERVRGTSPDGSSFGAIPRAAAEGAGIRFVVSPEPQTLAGAGLTTGRIALVSPERPKVPTAMRPGHGCAVAKLDPDKRSAEFLVDDAVHELGTVFVVRGHGLVVIGSCSHRGIINTVLRAQAVTGERRILAIVGGFHLVPPQTRAQAIETVELMKALDPRYVIPGHCSGETFIAAATEAMPGRVYRAPVGTRLSFGAV